MEDGLYMGRAEQRCLEEVKLRYDKNEIRYYGISIEEQQQLHVLIDTAQDTDGETTTFPDFIGENGWIEHFQVSSSKCNRKGNENNRKIASINRAIEKQIEDSINEESLIHPFSSSFCFNKDSLANYHKSFEDNWEKHYRSYLKEQGRLKDLEVSAFMLDSDDCFLKVARFEDMREGIIHRGNTELPFNILYDRTIMEYMLQYASHIKYIIFKNNFLVSVIKVTAIPTILSKINYENIFVHPIQGIMIHHGFHIGPNSNLPDCF